MNPIKISIPIILVLCAFSTFSSGFAVRIDASDSNNESLWNETDSYQFNVGIGINFDVVQAVRLAWEKTRYINSHAGFLRAMKNELYYNGPLSKFPEWGLMMFHLGNHYEWKGGPYNVYAYQTFPHIDRYYGVWVFKCGHFINHGARGWDQWLFSGSCMKQDGNNAFFEARTCPGQHKSMNFCGEL